MTETKERASRAARARWDARTPEQRSADMTRVAEGRKTAAKAVAALAAEVAELRAAVDELRAERVAA